MGLDVPPPQSPPSKPSLKQEPPQTIAIFDVKPSEPLISCPNGHSVLKEYPYACFMCYLLQCDAGHWYTFHAGSCEQCQTWLCEAGHALLVGDEMQCFLCCLRCDGGHTYRTLADGKCGACIGMSCPMGHTLLHPSSSYCRQCDSKPCPAGHIMRKSLIECQHCNMKLCENGHKISAAAIFCPHCLRAENSKESAKEDYEKWEIVTHHRELWLTISHL